MKALTDERWQEIRKLAAAEYPQLAHKALKEVLEQNDHLAEQIKLLADYIMSKRPDDPAWSLGEGACAMAVEIMNREANEIDKLKFDLTMKSLDNSGLKIRNRELNNAMLRKETNDA